MSKREIPPLIIEDLQDTVNHLYFTFIEYKREPYLTIVDNFKQDEISAYVLDFAEAENINLDWFLSVSNIWFYKSSDKYPLSFEFLKLGVKEKTTPILKTFQTDYVSRVVGKIFTYDINNKPKVKRKKVQSIPEGIEIKLKKN